MTKKVYVKIKLINYLIFLKEIDYRNIVISLFLFR